MMSKRTFAIGFLMALFCLAASEELLELTCLKELECRQFERPGVKVTCIEGHCKCRNTDGNSEDAATATDNATDEFIPCQPNDAKLSNVIGGLCPCMQPHAECNETTQICHCAVDYVPSWDRRRCISRVATLNETCEMDSQCQAVNVETFCHKKTRVCTCLKGFVEVNDTCASLVGPKYACKSEMQCTLYDERAVCAVEKGRCVCPPNYVSSTMTVGCLPSSEFGGNCKEDRQCHKSLGVGGQCKDGTCGCEDHHYTLKTKEIKETGTLSHFCERHVERGHYCRVDEDCHRHSANGDEEESSSMYCRHSECECKEGYNVIDGSGDCSKTSGHSGRSGDSGMSRKAVILGLVVVMLCLNFRSNRLLNL